MFKLSYYLLIFLFSTATVTADINEDAAILELESRILNSLICNSITGAAISEVTISTITTTSQDDVVKISGIYKQDKPFTGQLRMFSGNAFAMVTGQFQLFLYTVDNSIQKAKFKVGLRKGFVKASCLVNKVDDFDF